MRYKITMHRTEYGIDTTEADEFLRFVKNTPASVTVVPDIDVMREWAELIVSAEYQIDELKDRTQELESQIESLESDISDFEMREQDFEDKIRDLEEKVAQLEDENQDLTNELVDRDF